MLSLRACVENGRINVMLVEQLLKQIHEGDRAQVARNGGSIDPIIDELEETGEK